MKRADVTGQLPESGGIEGQVGGENAQFGYILRQFSARKHRLGGIVPDQRVRYPFPGVIDSGIQSFQQGFVKASWIENAVDQDGTAYSEYDFSTLASAISNGEAAMNVSGLAKSGKAIMTVVYPESRKI